jgi:hypothetical protein
MNYLTCFGEITRTSYLLLDNVNSVKSHTNLTV